MGRADKGACGWGETSVRAAEGGRGERIRTVTGTEEARELARRKERLKLRASEGEETRSSGIRGRRGSRGDTGKKKEETKEHGEWERRKEEEKLGGGRRENTVARRRGAGLGAQRRRGTWEREEAGTHTRE